MTKSIDDPEYLRSRGAELRTHAAQSAYLETKLALLRIADDFDLLARRAEQRLTAMAKQTTAEKSPPDDQTPAGAPT
jgi:hypothetical protein